MSKVGTGTDELLCEVDDGVALITFNRPDKRNALSETLTPALRAVLPELDRRRDVRCVMLTGAGPAFCAGGDVSQMGGNRLATGDERSLEEKVAELEQRQRTLTLRLFEMKTPTIAALPGAAAGAGMSIALACDLRIAAASAFVTAAFGRIGLSGDYGGSWLLSRLVGTAVAKDMYFTSRRVGAEEGLKLGLFNRVGHHAMLDRFSFLHSEVLHDVAHPVGCKNTHKVIFQGEIEPRVTRITLATGSAPKLIVDSATFMSFRCNHVQATCFEHLIVVLLPLGAGFFDLRLRGIVKTGYFCLPVTTKDDVGKIGRAHV